MSYPNMPMDPECPMVAYVSRRDESHRKLPCQEGERKPMTLKSAQPCRFERLGKMTQEQAMEAFRQGSISGFEWRVFMFTWRNATFQYSIGTAFGGSVLGNHFDDALLKRYAKEGYWHNFWNRVEGLASGKAAVPRVTIQEV